MRADPHDYLDPQPLRHMRFTDSMTCGMAGCDHMTTDGLIERDPETDGLWRLLPICATCQRELQSAARQSHRVSHGESSRSALWRDDSNQSVRYS